MFRPLVWLWLNLPDSVSPEVEYLQTSPHLPGFLQGALDHVVRHVVLALSHARFVQEAQHFGVAR